MENKSYIQSAIYPNHRTYFLKMVRLYGININENPTLLHEEYIITQHNNEDSYFTSGFKSKQFFYDRYFHNWYLTQYKKDIESGFIRTRYASEFQKHSVRFEITDMTTFDEVALPMIKQMFGITIETNYVSTYYQVKMLDVLSEEPITDIEYEYKVITEEYISDNPSAKQYPLTLTTFRDFEELLRSKYGLELGLDENGEGVVLIKELFEGEHEGIHKRLYPKMD